MGSFIGHSAPGTFFFLFGLWCWLQSLSDLKTLQPLRTSPVLLSFRPVLAIFGAYVICWCGLTGDSIFTMTMEIIDVLMKQNAHSHIEHIYIDILIALIGTPLSCHG